VGELRAPDYPLDVSKVRAWGLGVGRGCWCVCVGGGAGRGVLGVGGMVGVEGGRGLALPENRVFVFAASG